MTFEELFEQDRERLRAAVDGVQEQAAVAEIRKELDRLLLRFLAQEEEPRIQQAASGLVRAASGAAALLDSQGEAQVYGQTRYRTAGEKNAGRGGSHAESQKPGILFIVLIVAGLLCLGLAALAILSIGAAHLVRKLESILLCLLAGALFFAAGWRYRRKGAGRDEVLSVSIRVDAQKVCHRMSELMLTLDQQVEEARQENRRLERAATQEDEEPDGALLELLGDLLEKAYARRAGELGEADAQEAGEIIAEVRFFLHRRGIETADLEQSERGWFEFLPAGQAMTIRPAFVKDGILLRKGLASHG